MIGVPGSDNSSPFSSSILRRSLLQQRRQAAADAQVDAHLRVARVEPVHVVALLVGDHLERQLVVVAQEERPLAVLGDRRRLLQDVDDRKAVLHAQRHEHPRHQREVERHVALVAVAEVGDRVLRPLVRLGEEHAVLNWRRRAPAARFRKRASRAGSRSRALALEQVRHGVEPQAVDAQLEPEVEDAGSIASRTAGCRS
jgi:hypothetical protein